jgi:FAD/FMN-containing dehydrogenase
VIDLTAMSDVTLSLDYRAVRISGGARASNVLAVTDPRGLAVVTGSCSSVGMTGLTLGGGYGSLIGRFGLALDNLLAADVVLADGRIVTASSSNEQELFWALRGGGGHRRRCLFWLDALPERLRCCPISNALEKD